MNLSHIDSILLWRPPNYARPVAAWQTVSSRVAFENAWITIREDEVLRPDGSPGGYGVIEMRNDAVFVVAIDDDDRVVLVTVDRYTTGPGSIEVPAGGSDGEDPLVAARRELLEETGLEAEQWTRVGGMEALNGIARAREHVFIAQRLRQVKSAEATQHEEGIDAVQRLPFADVLTAIADGRIRDGESIASIALAAIHLGRIS